MTKKLLITGITGQVGSQLAGFVLKNTSYDVVGIMRWKEPMDNLYHLTDRINRKDQISLHHADLNDYSALARMLKAVRPDCISQRTNALFFWRIVSAACAKRLPFVDTLSVLDQPGETIESSRF